MKSKESKMRSGKESHMMRRREPRRLKRPKSERKIKLLVELPRERPRRSRRLMKLSKQSHLGTKKTTSQLRTQMPSQRRSLRN